MNPLLAQLDDIRGLDKVLVLVALVIVAGIVIYLRRRARERSWKGEAEKTLSALEEKLNDKTAQEVAAALSITLRRIAMQRFSRAACAGLEGKVWLQWLTSKDPRGFNWAEKGALLMDAPYLPPGKPLNLETIKTLLQATREWAR